jgi:ABC-type Fe3+/spermidine/putrescine transport system ATPase subunit
VCGGKRRVLCLAEDETVAVKPTDENDLAVELRGISKRFGSRVVLDDIDLAVARGEVLVVVGPSGCGKSTLLKIVSGIESADQGCVLLAGRDCTALPPYRRPVHTVFQNYALFPHLNVAENVEFPLKIAGMAGGERQRLVAEALEWVQLQQHAARRIGSLSGGERQRVALARALVDSPECLLLDEPLSALDPHLRAGTLQLLRDIQQRLGTTFIFITHDRDEALGLGHRIGVLNCGRLEQVGTPEEMYDRPKSAFVAAFLGRINWLDGRLDGAGDGRRLFIGGECVPCANGAQLPGGDVQIGIRPEDLQLVGKDGLSAIVVGRRFLGDSIQLELRLGCGSTLVADCREPALVAEPGTQLRVAWQPDAAHLFARNGQPPRGGADS